MSAKSRSSVIGQRPSEAQTSNRCLVVCAGQPLLGDRLHIVTACDDQFRRAGTEVLIELEFHAALRPGRSTKRPRLISAPYAMVARMSS